MTDKELKEWEEEAQETNYDIKRIITGSVIIGLAGLLLYIYSKIDDKNYQIELLTQQNQNQELFIEQLYQTREYKHAEKLQLEIMDLGAQLDSMHLKYDNVDTNVLKPLGL